MMDFEQLAFIEKWRQKASRGIVVVLDGTSGDIIVTLRVGEGAGARRSARTDATGAVRKHRLSIGDRVTMAIEYTAKDVQPVASAMKPGAVIGAGATVERHGPRERRDRVIDCGVDVLVRGDTLPGRQRRRPGLVHHRRRRARPTSYRRAVSSSSFSSALRSLLRPAPRAADARRCSGRCPAAIDHDDRALRSADLLVEDAVRLWRPSRAARSRCRAGTSCRRETPPTP